MRPAPASRVAVLVALLTVAVTPGAHAQPRRPVSAAQAAAIAGQAGAWDAYAWMTAAQAQQYATRMPPEQLEQAQAQYFTNGAAVMSVPSTGPGAAYFSNGAEMLVTPATSWVEGPLATPAPAAGTTAGGAGNAPDGGTPPEQTATTEAAAPESADAGPAETLPLPPPPPPPESTTEEEAGTAAPSATTTEPAPPTATAVPPLPSRGVTMMQGSSPAQEPASTETTAPPAARAAVHAQKASWLVPVAGGFVVCAFVALFAERLLRRRPAAR